MANQQNNWPPRQPLVGQYGGAHPPQQGIVRPAFVQQQPQQAQTGHPPAGVQTIMSNDGTTHNISFLNNCVSQFDQFLPPLCLIVDSTDHRPQQLTAFGPLPVTNTILRTGDGHKVEACGWRQQANVLAALTTGKTYWFFNCRAKARYQQTDCWYRISVDGFSAYVVEEPPQATQPLGRAGSQTQLDPRPGPSSRDRPPQRRAAEPIASDVNRLFVVERSTPMRNVSRNTRGEIAEIRFLPLEDTDRPDLLLPTLIQQLLDRVLQDRPPALMVGLQLHAPGLERPFVVRLRPPEQNNAATLAAAIERLNEQSAAGIDLLSGTTVAKVLAVWPLEQVRTDSQRGGACEMDQEHHVSHNVQSLVRVQNPGDRHCLARAVLLGMRDRRTRMPGGGGRDTFNMYAAEQHRHGPEARNLLRRAGISRHKDLYTLEDVEQLQLWVNNIHGFGEIRLAVFEKEQEFRIVFKGEGRAANFDLCLLFERGHFNYIGRIEQLFHVAKYCIDYLDRDTRAKRNRRSLPPKRLCTTGLKIYSMRLSGNNQRRITFKDSINYFFCELDALVKSFDLPADLATVKPFFPYLYIQRQHLHQRLAGLPPMEFYAPDTMKADKRQKFLRWYETNNNAFQLREQLIMYCVNDVAILRESVIRFRQLIGEHTQGLDPFTNASTAAGLALSTLRRCFLPANRLVHSPEGGYLRGRRASAESQRYIRFFELENPGAQVQCASWSVGEAHIEDSGYRVDGLWVREQPLRPLAIEWMGCYYHGCPDCFPNRQQRLAAGRTAEDLCERTVRRLWELEHVYGCDIHAVWACNWKDQLRRDQQLKQRYDGVFVPCPLDPRNDALRGGRTEPFKLHHVCAPDEEILCIDIVSLYPYVMKVNPFPVGNPRVLTREVLLEPPTAPLPWTAPTEYRGLLLVRVLAPRDIRIPLLGYRTKDGRFTFPLCAWCADRKQQRPCRHSPEKRSWVTAYTHVELNKALELGYQVTDVFEVWDYAEWDDTLFRSYVNTFVGLKVQASGWPDGCVTEEQRQQYLDDFWQTEGIRLDPAKIAPNPGLRLIAKTLANSLWGKLAQRVGHTEVRYTRTPAEFHRLLEDPTLDKLDFVHVSPHMDRCVVRKRPEFAKAPPTNCLPVAIFVTSYARLHLYSYMEQVLALDGAELLYCDTDSIYYVNKMGGPCVPEGEALGQMKREQANTNRHLTYQDVSRREH
uniref:DNA-directed DNA polymerase n=1 Tax=Globodera pallida TaxID=36090 RepID=A0A183C758_GLOPA